MISRPYATPIGALAPLVAAALSLSAASCSAPLPSVADPTSAVHPLLGKPAPELTSAAVGGEGPKNLKAALGKVVIVDFWATFCEPCKRSFPKYQEMVEQFGGQVAVVAVSVDAPDAVSKDQLLAFAQQNHAKFAIAWDRVRGDIEHYGLRSLTIPSSFIIDRTGTVRHVHVGFVEGEETRIEEELKALVK